MGLRAYKSITPDEFLQFEIASPEKHEFLNGEIVNMAGASKSHNFIFMNLAWHMRNALKETGCHVLGADQRIATPFFDSYMYPDIVVACGEWESSEDDKDTLTNPSVIIEILSPSTQARDIGEKFWLYLRIPSLREYIMIDSTTAWCRMVSRDADNKLKITESSGSDGVMQIESLNLSMRFEDIYKDVSLENK